MLEKALLPGWAPDATQLIHFYSQEQVPRASQAASLKLTLFIWPQALGKPEGTSHDSITTCSQNTLQVPCRTVAQHRVPLHHLILTCVAERAPGAAAALSGTLWAGPWSHRCARILHMCFRAAAFSAAATSWDLQPPVALWPDLCVHTMKNMVRNSFLPLLSPVPIPVLTFAAQTRMGTSREHPWVQRLRDLQQDGESQYLWGGKEKNLLLELEMGKARGFVFHLQATAMW